VAMPSLRRRTGTRSRDLSASDGRRGEVGTDLTLAARAPIGRLMRGERSDAALVADAVRGSEAAVAALFARHWDDAYRAARIITRDAAAAEDIAQESFLAALRALDRFDRRRPLRPWLHRIVVNRAIDFSRARALRREVAPDALDVLPAREAVSDVGDVPEAIGRLDPDQRAVVVLRYLLEFTPGELDALGEELEP
jgi:RNA polymerase sigma-70 factor (ECF subfamily)